jgi:putative SOS response-associated peptidase YedK
MCGRFTLTASTKQMVDFFGLPEVPVLAPRYNIAPTQQVLAVRREGTEEPRVVLLRWGLIPSWAKDPGIGNQMINARSETVAEKPAFRTALRRRRCLVPADGFYEWQKRGRTKTKQPYCFRRSGDRLFAFAGLWDRWAGPDGVVESCSLLTTEANDLVRPVHDRMPVILPEAAFAEWLDPSLQDPEKILPLLGPFPAEEMHAFAVSSWVSDARHEDARCLEPA